MDWKRAVGIAGATLAVQIIVFFVAFWPIYAATGTTIADSLAGDTEELDAESIADLFALDVEWTWLAVTSVVTGAGVLIVVTIASWMLLARLYAAAMHGRRLSIVDLMTSSLRRLPRVVGWGLAFIVASIAVMGVLVGPGFLEPRLLLLTIPVVLVLVIWLAPYLSVFWNTLALGPEAAPIAQTRTVVRESWGFLFRCGIIIGLAQWVLGIVTELFAASLSLAGLAGEIIAFAVSSVALMMVYAAGVAAFHDHSGAPLDSGLGPPDSEVQPLEPSLA